MKNHYYVSRKAEVHDNGDFAMIECGAIVESLLSGDGPLVHLRDLSVPKLEMIVVGLLAECRRLQSRRSFLEQEVENLARTVKNLMNKKGR